MTERRLTSVHRPSWIATLAAAFSLSGCVSTVTPPAAPEQPTDVVLVRDARHVGLFLPRRDGTYVEYGFGDWDWYAQMDDAWYDVFDTVFLPTTGTLARREIEAADADALSGRFHWMPMWTLQVDADRAAALLAELDREFASAEEPPFHNPRYSMDFVRHADSYWFPHNCYDAVSDWLRALDCRVTPLPIRLGLTVDDAENDG